MTQIMTIMTVMITMMTMCTIFGPESTIMTKKGTQNLKKFSKSRQAESVKHYSKTGWTTYPPAPHKHGFSDHIENLKNPASTLKCTTVREKRLYEYLSLAGFRSHSSNMCEFADEQSPLVFLSSAQR